MEKKVLTEYYNNIATYLLETLGANFIFLTIVLSTASAVAYFIVISYIITQIDKDYFLRKKMADANTIEPSYFTAMNSSVTLLIKISKIIIGICLLAVGLVMLVLPGQGLITVLIGLSLLPFPGKNKIEQSILSRKAVRSTLNWIRIKANKEPFNFD